MAWTEKSVKDQLPAVKVRLPDGQVLEGQTGGRLLPACVVWIWSYLNRNAVNVTFPIRQEFSWASVVDSLNKSRPLLMPVETRVVPAKKQTKQKGGSHVARVTPKRGRKKKAK